MAHAKHGNSAKIKAETLKKMVNKEIQRRTKTEAGETRRVADDFKSAARKWYQDLI